MTNPLARLLVLPTRRPVQTLVYVSAESLVRLDLDDKGRVIDAPEQERETRDLEGLPEALDSALSAGGAPGRRLWLLSPFLPTQSLDLASAQIRGLEPAQLAQALGFELEALGGPASQGAVMGVLPQGEEDGLAHFRVTQIPQGVLERLQALAARAKVRLAGLAHPGGLPVRLDDQGREAGADQPWARLELWPEGLLAVHGAGDQAAGQSAGPRAHSEMCGNGGRPSAWLSEAERWLARRAPVRSLCWLRTGSEVPGQGDLLDIRRPEARRAWLEVWARLLSGRAVETLVPLIRPPRADAERQERDWRLSGILVSLLLCMAHYSWLGMRNDQLSLETLSLEAAERGLALVEKGLKTEQDRVAKLQGELARLDQSQGQIPWALDVLRKRPLRLLDALAAGRSEGLVVSRLGTRADAVLVQGLTLAPGDPDDLAAVLSRRLEGLGWRVAPPSKQGLALLAGGGPWSFEIRLEDRGLDGWVPAGQGGGG